MDEKLLVLINQQWTNPAMDRFMALMSSSAFWLGPLVVAALLTLWLGGFKARSFLCCALVLVAIGDGLVVNTLKKRIDRPRPHQAMTHVRMIGLEKTRPALLELFAPVRVRFSTGEFEPGSGRSFPSAHTSNNISVATLLGLYYRRWGWLYFFPALTIGYSRIYVGAHWPSDIVASCFLAVGMALLLLAIFELTWRKWGPIVLPVVWARHPSLAGDGIP